MQKKCKNQRLIGTKLLKNLHSQEYQKSPSTELGDFLLDLVVKVSHYR